jgi:hypothetical protein
MSIVIDPDIEAKLLSRAHEEGLSVDAYLTRLIEEETAEIEHTETLLQEAIDSGDYIELDEAEWARIESEAFAEVRARAATRATTDSCHRWSFVPAPAGI